MIQPVYDCDGIQIYHGDCREILPHLSKVDLVLTDPPYFRVKAESWDRQWKTVQDYVLWMEGVTIECKRLLTDNGSLYMFCDAWVSAYLQTMIDKHMIFLNHIVWYKTNNQSIKAVDNLRSFAPMTERILFYTNENSKTGLQTIHDDKDCFAPIKSYMREERQKCMDSRGFKTIEEFNQYIRVITETSNVVDRHYFADSQYVFPTKELYVKLQETGFWRRDYESLRRDYESLRRVFQPQRGITDVISEPIVNQSENTTHPTTKPMRIISPFISASSQDGDTILDPFIGSGTTLVAAKHLGRKAIGIEIEEKYVEIAIKRLGQGVLPL